VLTHVRDFLEIHTDRSLRSHRFLLGVSGGLDSMVLLELCRRLELNCAVATVNYHLRPEADRETELVLHTAAEAGFACYQLHPDVAQLNGNLQEQARQQRMNFFQSLLEEKQFDWVLLANHAGDLVETMLIRQLQGRHPLLWGGFAPVRGRILRPLIEITRQQIEQWAREHNVAWLEDGSNQEDSYLRNRVRHHLLPLMQELVGREDISRWRKNVTQLRQIRELQDELLELESARCLLQKGGYRFLLDKERFQGYTSRLQSQLLLRLIQQLTAGQYTPGERVLLEVLENLKKRTGGMRIGDKLQMRHNTHTVLLLPTGRELPELPLLRNGHPQQLPGTGQVICQEVTEEQVTFSSDAKVEFVSLPDSAVCKYRHWRSGDSYLPLGRRQPRKVVDLLSSRGILDRNAAYLLECNGSIVWVVGQAISEEFRVEKKGMLYKLKVIEDETS
jgi:tRNA(Ile)-lysidine synthase